MVIKKFEATSVEQALTLVKNEFGPEALIISTEQKRGRWLNKGAVVVTAALDKERVKAAVDQFDEEELNQIFPNRNRPNFDEAKIQAARTKAPAPTEIKAAPRGNAIDPLKYEPELKRVGFSENAATELSRRLVFDYPSRDLLDSHFLKKTKQKVVAGYFYKLSDDVFSKPESWVAVGMPGVGKTALLVKIAMTLKDRGRALQLVSFDSRKLVGRSEMAAYAKTLDVPFTTENSVSLQSDVTQLVDTPGFCLREPDSIEELLPISRHRKVVLVLDASQRGKESLRALEAIRRLEPQAIALTKLDLVESPAVIFDVVKRAKLPVLALSTSRSMKTGLKLLNVDQLAECLLTGAPPTMTRNSR